MTADQIDRLVAGHLREPHSILGAHPQDGSTVVRAWRPEAQTVQVLVDGEVTAKLERVHPSFSRDRLRRIEDYELGSDTLTEDVTMRDPYSSPTRRARIHPPKGSPPPLREAGRAPARRARGRRRVVRGVGSQRAQRTGRRRVQQLGRAPEPDAQPGQLGHLGVVRPRSGSGRLVPVRGHDRAGRPRPQSRPLRVRDGGGAQARVQSCTSRRTSERHRGDEGRPTKDYRAAPCRLRAHVGSWRRTQATSHSPIETWRRCSPTTASRWASPTSAAPGRRAHPFGARGATSEATTTTSPPRRATAPPTTSGISSTRSTRPGRRDSRLGAGTLSEDEWALARFDGRLSTSTSTPRRGAPAGERCLQPTGGTRFATSSLQALYWSRSSTSTACGWTGGIHVYLDYSRSEGEWAPTQFGGCEKPGSDRLPEGAEHGDPRRGPRRGDDRRGVDRVAGVSLPCIWGLGFGYK